MNDPVAGGYYAYRVPRKYCAMLGVPRAARGKTFRVVKVWKVDEHGSFLRIYSYVFIGPVGPFDPSELGPVLVATYPVTREFFASLEPECVLVGEVTEEELEGYEIDPDGGIGYLTVHPEPLLEEVMMKTGGMPWIIIVRPPLAADLGTSQPDRGPSEDMNY
jgi:hypothetical protein